MNYQISRNGQQYGPYTFEDIQRYVTSGNVLLTDMAKSDEMADWIPVSQLLAPAQASPTAFAFSTPGYANPESTQTYTQPYGQPVTPAIAYPDAPNLHWGLVVLFAFLTCGLFMIIWNLVISAWLRRVQPNANALFFYLGVVGLFFVSFVVNGVATAHMVINPGDRPSIAMFGPLFGVRVTIGFAIWVVRLIARYSERASLEEHFNTAEPMGLQLNPVMTFFFGGVYFQSQLNRINAMKQAARYGAGRSF